MTRLTAAVETAADRALLRLLRRMASFVRHDLAGATLVPQTQLQLLRRRLQKPDATLETAIAGIDAALLRLHELSHVHQYSVSWLALHDTTPAAVDEVLRRVATAFGLHFSLNGISVTCGLLVPGMTYSAQPLHLLVNACFFAILDSEPSPGVLNVACKPGANEITLEWHLETGVGTRAIDAPTDIMTEPGLRLDAADVTALCKRYGCTVVPGDRRWALHLDSVGLF